MQNQLIAGFQNPVADAQAVFRTALCAMSEPGLPQNLPMTEGLDSLQAATWAVLQTLLDADVKVYLADSVSTEKVRSNVLFHTGCELTNDKAQADFIVCDLATALTWDWRGLKRGTERSPEHSATLIIQIDALAGEAHSVWQGPGIEHQRDMHTVLDKNFWLKRAAAMAFPLGVDVMLVAGQHLIGLPRTTQVQFEPVTEQGAASCM